MARLKVGILTGWSQYCSSKEVFMEDKRAHLEMIQAIIKRMSVNSFQLKGWSVVLVSALFALAAADSQALFVYLAYFPCIAFWMLDGYFLRQERLFRKLYDRVRQLEEPNVDFSMDTSVVAEEVADWSAVMVSKTLLLFHGTVLGSIVIVMLVVIFAH
jgi:hypothetical protein